MTSPNGNRTIEGVIFIRTSLPHQQFNSDENDQPSKTALEIICVYLCGEPCAEITSHHRQWCNGQHGAPFDVRLRVMFVRTHDGRGDDDDERGADGLLDVSDWRAKKPDHCGHHHDAAAHAEKSAGHAADKSDDGRDVVIHAGLMPVPMRRNNFFLRDKSVRGFSTKFQTQDGDYL